MQIPILETERLLLRGIREEDLNVLSSMMQDEDVIRFIGGTVLDRMDTWRTMATLMGHWHFRGFGFFALEEKATGEFVGRVGPWQPEGWPALEIGWTIAKPAWGRGYATEAAIAAGDWIFEQKPELQRLISIIHDDNLPSQAVARKIGEHKTDEVFTYKGEGYPVWAISRTAWKAGKKI